LGATQDPAGKHAGALSPAVKLARFANARSSKQHRESAPICAIGAARARERSSANFLMLLSFFSGHSMLLPGSGPEDPGGIFRVKAHSGVKVTFPGWRSIPALSGHGRQGSRPRPQHALIEQQVTAQLCSWNTTTMNDDECDFITLAIPELAKCRPGSGFDPLAGSHAG